MNVRITDEYIELTVACDDCGATGLFQGFAEPSGTAVICRECDGTGGRILRFKPYTGRKMMEGIRHIEIAGAIWFTPEETDRITYDEFTSRVPETPQETTKYGPVNM